MTLTEEILTILTSYEDGYRLMRTKMRGYNSKFSPPKSYAKFWNASDNTFRVTLSRLKKRGLAQNKNGLWKGTREGDSWLAARRVLFAFPKHSRNSREKKRKNMVITFDIPEIHRRKRNWLRCELVNLGFEILQKSVWFGPAPLPAQFIESLEELKIISHMKFFEAKEADIV